MDADELLAAIEAARHDGRHRHGPTQTHGLVDALATAVVALLEAEKRRER